LCDNDVEPDTTNDDEPVSSNAGRYDVSKLVGGADDGAGFNQFDPVLKATGFLSRRFGILGGLTIFAALAAVEGREIFKSFDDATPTPATNGVTITTDSGLKITDVLIGKGGSTPFLDILLEFVPSSRSETRSFTILVMKNQLHSNSVNDHSRILFVKVSKRDQGYESWWSAYP
jgi:hypothetical protein